MAKAYILMGIPGSGKTQHALKLKEQHEALGDKVVCLSGDEMRLKLFGSITNQKRPDVIWDAVHREARKAFMRGCDVVIIDGTHSKRRDRVKSIQSCHAADEIEVHWMVESFEQCVEWNEARDRTVELDVLIRMNDQIIDEPPISSKEGFTLLMRFSSEEPDPII